MALFRRDPAAPPPSGAAHPSPEPAAGGRAVTRIAPGTRIHGRITGATDLSIDGELIGDVDIEATLAIGAEGRIEGTVAARVVRLAGKVKGDVRGAERVEVAATGQLEGDISAPRVTIAEGAFFKGRVEMKTLSGAAPAGSPAVRTPHRIEGAKSAPPSPPEGRGTD